MESFINKVIHVTRVVPVIEKVFRDDRESRILEIKKEVEEIEKAGGGAGRFGGGGGMRGGIKGPQALMSNPNLTEEEKNNEWNIRW